MIKLTNILIVIYAAALIFVLLPSNQVNANTVDACSRLNNICIECTDKTMDVASECQCKTGNFYDGSKCDSCSSSCENCSAKGDDKCTSCNPTIEGLGLNTVDNKCECMPGYKTDAADKTKCVQCYTYGSECELKCPTGMRKNDKYMQCENDSEEDVENDDDILYIIVTICLIVLIILLMVLLYNYFSGVFKKIFAAEKDKVLPLNEEEKFYLANQQEFERLRKQQEEEMERQRALEEQQRQEEEERRRRKLEEEEEARRLAEEARLAAIEEEARKRREEEEEKRRAEEQALREMEEAAEAARLAEEARLRAEAEEAERLRQLDEAERERQRLADEEAKRLAAEEAARLEAERLERERLEAEERERQRLKELARQARNQKLMERQLTKQKTMAANDAKLQAMREAREKLEREKKEMEDYNAKQLADADAINSKFGTIAERMEKARLRRQETIAVKQNILQRQATIAEQRKELDAALEGVDFGAALRAVKEIKEEDIVFLQNLRTPPERIKLCLEAVITVLTNSTKKITWDDIKKEISNINFRKNLLTYDPESMTDKVFNKVKKEYTNNPQWNLAKIHKASVAAGAFATWLDAVVKFKQIKVENKPLFDKIKQLQGEERAMAGDVAKLDDLEDEEKAAEQEGKQMEEQTEQFKEKQKMLQKQATLNQGDIADRDDKIKKLKTDELSLGEIEEDEDESEIDSDCDMETLKALNDLKKM